MSDQQPDQIAENVADTLERLLGWNTVYALLTRAHEIVVDLSATNEMDVLGNLIGRVEEHAGSLAENLLASLHNDGSPS